MSDTATATVAWTEIPVTDLDAAKSFYETVFSWEMQRDDTGPNPILNFSGNMNMVSGHLYLGKPSSDGPTIHLMVPDTLEAARARVEASGGKVTSDNVPLPVGRFCYANDPDGNSIGLFEMAA